jgi:hypothetical protein
MRMYQTETLYHAQIDWTCLLLDVVDEVADSKTAEKITDAIFGRLAGDGAAEAAQRVRDAQAEFQRIMGLPVPRARG